MNEEVVSAIVLRFTAFGEADRMASLLMADGSRREVRVAQARKSRKRFGGFDLYVLAECRFTPDRRGRAQLQSVEITEPHEGLRGELVRSALAAHVVELVLQASQEGHPLPDLHRLALAALGSIASGHADGQARGWARGFELKLLHVLSVRPSLARDALTGEPLRHEGLRWSTTHGGVVNPGGPTDARSLPIAAGTLAAMNESLRTPLAEQASVDWTVESAGQAERALLDFLAVHVGRRTRARTFLDEVLGGMSAVALMGFALLATGCVGYQAPSVVRVQGYLFESPEPAEDAAAVTGTSSRAFDDFGALIAEGSEPFSDTPGWVRFSNLPPLTRHHHEFVPPDGEADHPDATEHVATVVVGESSSDDLFVDAGSFHLWTRADVDGWLSDWAEKDPSLALPTLDPTTDDGGFVRAVVEEPEAGLRFAVVDANQDSWPAVYADADGAASVTQDGLSGSGIFFVFGPAAGPAVLRLVEVDGTLSAESMPLWIAEDGVTSLPSLGVAL